MEKSIADEYAELISSTKRATSVGSGELSSGGKPSQQDTPDRRSSVRSDNLINSGDVNPVPDVKDSYPACGVYKDGELKELNVTSSLINELYFNSEYRPDNGTPICPKKIYHNYLLGDIQSKPTDAMIKGQYFETQLIGSGVNGFKREAPLLKSGKKPIDIIRIDNQVEMAEMVFHKYGIIKDYVQIERKVPIEYKEHTGVKFFLKAHADLVSPIHMKGFDYPYAVLDVKLTQDRNNRFGDYCWGSPEFMNHNQPLLYSFVFNLPFAYLLFDYRPKDDDAGYKIIPVITTAMKNLDDSFKNVAKQRAVDLKVTIQNVIDKIVAWDIDGYPPEPGATVCKRCPLNPLNGGNCSEAYLPTPI